MNKIPEIGKTYKFYDNGVKSPSRTYEATVIRIVPYNEEVILKKYIYNFDNDTNSFLLVPIQGIHKREVEKYDWIFAKTTDYFVECKIPKYDDNTIWFARTKNGGWFSMDIQNCWQSGELDVK